jgi:apolipoprotein N-acyltransferase
MRALPRGLALSLALLAGLAQAASLAVPWSGQAVWWLQLVSLGVLATLVTQAPSARAAAVRGWVFGTAWLAATFWWLFISMHVYGGLPAPLAALAVLALAGFLALYYAAACGLQRRLSPAVPRAGRVLLFGALWLLAELARGSWFTGFPWGAGGYAHVDGPLVPLARHVGVYGLGLAAACLAFALADFLAHPLERARWPGLLLVPMLAAWTWWAAPLTGQATGRLDVVLLQGNIPQDEKFQPGTGVPQALQWYGAQLGEAKAALVVAPETAIPLLPTQLPPDYWDALRARFSDGRQAALVGVPLGSLREGYTNSVIGLKDDAKPYTYDKHHLVPFGEFIPPLFKWFTQMMNIPLGDFNRGAVGQASFAWRGQRLAPNICYEDLFGEELGARFADPAQAPTIFVNLSNIGWFGNTVAIDQHLHISRLRAIEFERPMLRATNTGATVVIDHAGRVTHALARHTRGVLAGEVEGRTGTTPYAAWVARAGLWPLWGLGLAVLALAWLAAWRRAA